MNNPLTKKQQRGLARRENARVKRERWFNQKMSAKRKRCNDCGGYMQWCSICNVYTQTCCVDYGTCMCS